MGTVFLDFDGHTDYAGNPLSAADYPRIDPGFIRDGLERRWWPFEIDFITGIEIPHDHRIVFTGENLFLGGSYVNGYSLLNIYGKSPADGGPGLSTLPYASYVGSRSNWVNPNPGLLETASHELGHAVGIPHSARQETTAPLARGTDEWLVGDLEAIASGPIEFSRGFPPGEFNGNPSGPRGPELDERTVARIKLAKQAGVAALPPPAPEDAWGPFVVDSALAPPPLASETQWRSGDLLATGLPLVPWVQDALDRYAGAQVVFTQIT